MMGWYDETWSWTGAFWMLLMMTVWVGLIAMGIWTVARLSRSGAAQSSSVESPRQILDRRFASGEIDAEQYAQARHVLEGRAADTSGLPH